MSLGHSLGSIVSSFCQIVNIFFSWLWSFILNKLSFIWQNTSLTQPIGHLFYIGYSFSLDAPDFEPYQLYVSLRMLTQYPIHVRTYFHTYFQQISVFHSQNLFETIFFVFRLPAKQFQHAWPTLFFSLTVQRSFLPNWFVTSLYDVSCFERRLFGLSSTYKRHLEILVLIFYIQAKRHTLHKYWSETFPHLMSTFW